MTNALKGASPRIAIEPGSVILLRRHIDPTFQRLVFQKRIERHGEAAAELEFLKVDDRQTMFFSDAEIGNLQRQGSFAVVSGPDGRRIEAPPPLMTLRAEDLAYAQRCRDYVSACRDLGPDFYRSRRILLPIIERVACERNEAAPGFTTVLGWIDKIASAENMGTPIDAAFARRRTQPTLAPSVIEKAIAHGISVADQVRKGTAQDAEAAARIWLKEHHPDLGPDVEWPSLRTIQRRMSERSSVIRHEDRKGRRSAEARYLPNFETKRPLLPLEEVEVDHTPLDVICVDEARSIIFGRPDVITFKDRATGCVLGLSVGFEAASYASFLDGLRHAIYPKDQERTPHVANPWFCWGRPRRLYVDNALHFIGKNIREAGAQLGFQLAEFVPANPWLKGAQERLFRTLNMQVHKLPGATYSNVVERKDFAEVAGVPILTRREVWEFLSHYICDIYHLEAHEGLGPLRTLSGIPRRLWQAGIEQVEIAPLPSEETFVALAGDVRQAAVTQKGIRWDYIRYNSEQLMVLLADPHHRRGRTDGELPGTKHFGTKYTVRRDPFDLGSVWVTDPYGSKPRVIRVPAVRTDYANDLTLHQHRVYIANVKAKELRESKEAETLLIAARERLVETLIEASNIRAKQGVEKRLARYLYQGAKKRERSIVVPQPRSQGAIDPRRPASMAETYERQANLDPCPRSGGLADAPEMGAAPISSTPPMKPASAPPPGPRRAASPPSQRSVNDIERLLAESQEWGDV